MHELHQHLADGEAKPRAAVFPCRRAVGLGKGDKEFVQLLLAHADTLIADGKEQRDVFAVHTLAEDFDFDGSLMRKFDGIGNEIQHDLADAQRIADQYVGNARINMGFERFVRRFGFGLIDADDIAHQLLY